MGVSAESKFTIMPTQMSEERRIFVNGKISKPLNFDEDATLLPCLKIIKVENTDFNKESYDIL